MSILCCRLHRGHPPTCTLWASHYQRNSMAGLSLSLSLLSLFSSPLCLPSAFHLYSLHDDTPAMLSWQQSGPDCLVARQLTSPIRGTWRHKARDKQIIQNMCACTLLWRVWVHAWLSSHGVISSRCLFHSNGHVFLFKHVGSKVYH